MSFKCKKGFKVYIGTSMVGYYLGTRTKEGYPNCRFTGYFNSRDEAESALKEGTWKRRVCEENNFCCGSTCNLMEVEEF